MAICVDGDVSEWQIEIPPNEIEAWQMWPCTHRSIKYSKCVHGGMASQYGKIHHWLNHGYHRRRHHHHHQYWKTKWQNAWKRVLKHIHPKRRMLNRKTNKTKVKQRGIYWPERRVNAYKCRRIVSCARSRQCQSNKIDIEDNGDCWFCGVDSPLNVSIGFDVLDTPIRIIHLLECKLLRRKMHVLSGARRAPLPMQNR